MTVIIAVVYYFLLPLLDLNAPMNRKTWLDELCQMVWIASNG